MKKTFRVYTSTKMMRSSRGSLGMNELVNKCIYSTFFETKKDCKTYFNDNTYGYEIEVTVKRIPTKGKKK